MCGIAGFLAPGPLAETPELTRRLAVMAASLDHRGPDSRGTWTDDMAGLAASRLAILDRSAAGNQPLADSGGEVQVVFNGEIYNHAALRQTLEKAGHSFRGHCDTEVVLNSPLIKRLFPASLPTEKSGGENRLAACRDPQR